MQCGTAVHPARSAQSGLKFGRPAVIGGIVLGFLSTLPFVNLGNLFFGAWILAGGAIAARLLMKQRPNGIINYGDSAFAGALSGLVGAVIAALAVFLNKLLVPLEFEKMQHQFEQQISKVPESDGPLKDLMLRALSPEISVTTELFYFFIFGFLFSLIAMLGGMLMVWISKRHRPLRMGK